MRETQSKHLPETVYVQKLTRVSDSSGGWSEVWQTAFTTKGRISPGQKSQGTAVLGGAVAEVGEYLVTLPHDVEVDSLDRLQIRGTQYEIKAVLDRSEKTALRVLVEKV
ncbi:MAG: phage head closure protein [Candidatus Methanomethylicaceae archaeon]